MIPASDKKRTLTRRKSAQATLSQMQRQLQQQQQQQPLLCPDETLVEKNESEKLTFRINVEAVRVFAYVFFWMWVSFAVYITDTVTRPILLHGPENPDDRYASCPPFSGPTRENGFDVRDDSHLRELFGYNNVREVWGGWGSHENYYYFYKRRGIPIWKAFVFLVPKHISSLTLCFIYFYFFFKNKNGYYFD